MSMDSRHFSRCLALASMLILSGEGVGPAAASEPTGSDSAVARLAAEVRDKGWIAYGARAEHGDWDLFLSRPDGSDARPLTRTPEFNEFTPQFSRDGRKLLYRRVPKSEAIDNNRHGE